ncbi:hypothetical protein EES43_07945 [Streptomyces sp. ADI96-02]|uniref:hypothetical protein n=1 Tax=Streptomyces sp. ADI96-02 TaxID=1522760 RepID=UPI000F553897|nr:hypothetical protein [Streptomyces sp. ADI96-02]RPK65646.1 hypothetical protein EES43_07945 [Streptomyces sp. ADI96-02]
MRTADLLLYARVHRTTAILIGVSAVAVLSALFGGTRIPLPSFGSAGTTEGIPYRQELPLMSAVFLTAVFGGAMAAHEEAAASRAHRVAVAHLVLLSLTACALSFATESLAVGLDAGLVYVRSLLVWLGLALLSVRLFGPQHGWILPLASAFPLVWFGPNRWNWTESSAADGLGWTIAAASLAVGSTAVAATRWRIRAAGRGGLGAWSRRPPVRPS